MNKGCAMDTQAPAQQIRAPHYAELRIPRVATEMSKSCKTSQADLNYNPPLASSSTSSSGEVMGDVNFLFMWNYAIPPDPGLAVPEHAE